MKILTLTIITFTSIFTQILKANAASLSPIISSAEVTTPFDGQIINIGEANGANILATGKASLQYQAEVGKDEKAFLDILRTFSIFFDNGQLRFDNETNQVIAPGEKTSLDTKITESLSLVSFLGRGRHTATMTVSIQGVVKPFVIGDINNPPIVFTPNNPVSQKTIHFQIIGNCPPDTGSNRGATCRVIPEPSSTIALLVLGTLGTGSALLRKQKQYKSKD